MMRNWKLVAAVTAVAVMAGAAGLIAPATAERSADSELPDVCERRPRGRGQQIATAKLIIEFNSTDDDLGVHGAFDDQGWSELCVFDPSGRPIAAFDPHGRLDQLTMAGVFFESREPPADEFSMEDLEAAFPEGQYDVRGRSFDGRVLTGSATFTHDVPAALEIIAPVVGDDADQPGPPEVLALEESGNQTISVGFFLTS